MCGCGVGGYEDGEILCLSLPVMEVYRVLLCSPCEDDEKNTTTQATKQKKGSVITIICHYIEITHTHARTRTRTDKDLSESESICAH